MSSMMPAVVTSNSKTSRGCDSTSPAQSTTFKTRENLVPVVRRKRVERVAAFALVHRDHDSAASGLESLDDFRHDVRRDAWLVAQSHHRGDRFFRHGIQTTSHGMQHLVFGVRVRDEMHAPVGERVNNGLSLLADHHENLLRGDLAEIQGHEQAALWQTH